MLSGSFISRRLATVRTTSSQQTRVGPSSGRSLRPNGTATSSSSFQGGVVWRARVLEAERPRRFVVTYFGETTVAFDLESDGSGGCELTLADTADDPETRAGWVSVLLALKAAVDFGIDLRNHDVDRTWSSGYADN